MTGIVDDSLVWLAWTGMETDLIFNKGYDLPEFAAFPMVDSDDGRARLRDYYEKLIEIGRDTGTGIILDTPTWMANPDRAAPVGYAAADLPRVTMDGVALAREVARAHEDVATCISVQIGPRGDGYEAGIAEIDTAAAYHRPQIDAARTAGADVVSAYTLGSTAEAIGIAKAAEDAGIDAIISFTVETDGRLPDETLLKDAVQALSEAAPTLAIMVNCAHPDHIAQALDGGGWQGLLSGVVANASRMSHEELDNSETLDDGDPAELGGQLAALAQGHARMRILGGCCGTDLRHLRATAEQVGTAG